MSRGGKPSGSSTLGDFYKHVPAKVREDIKNKLLEAHVNGMDGFIEATQYIIAQLVSGNIAPEVATAAKGYMELMFTAISAKMIHDNESGAAKTLFSNVSGSRGKEKKQKNDTSIYYRCRGRWYS